VLACGPDAFVSHLSALALHGVAVAPRDIVDVTVLGRRVRCRGIRSHQTGAFHPADVCTLGGIRVVRPARALLDCAPTLTARELAGAVEQAQVKRLITRSQIIAAIERAPTRAGAAALRALVDQPGFTRSRAERIVRSLMRAADLPQPEFNADVDGSEVDALWRVQRVVLEFDSYEFHATRAAFERDRAKTAALTRGRYLVLRTTWTELTSRSHALVARTAEALALSAGAATGSPARGVP
jgi:very-short-patch-repair endonuclease